MHGSEEVKVPEHLAVEGRACGRRWRRQSGNGLVEALAMAVF